MGEEIRYCAFIDLLGYGSLVLDEVTTTQHKLKMLNSIYTSLATQFMLVINDVNKQYENKIYIRSFSDSFYLDCAAAEPLLVAVKTVYDYVFGFYSNFLEIEERTPLLRCGIVKDWLIKFNDIGAMVSGTKELNPIGPAVARAYNTSEKSGLSGMRVIISPEVLEDLNLLQVSITEFPCFCIEVSPYNIRMTYHFKHHGINENGQPINIYEMLWPITRLDSEPHDCIDTLTKIKTLYPTGCKAKRHFDQTVMLFIDSIRMVRSSYWDIENNSRHKQSLQKLLVD